MKQFAFLKSADLDWNEPFVGVRRQVISGKNLTLCLYHLKAGLDFPQHEHPQEQMAYVIKGKVEFTMGEEGTKHIFEEGMFFCFAPGVKHGGRFLEDSIVLDVFGPSMEQYDAEAVKPEYAQESCADEAER